MQTVELRGKTGEDGILHLSIPLGSAEAEFEVVVVVQQVKLLTVHPSWPPGFFEATAGGIKDDTFVRQPQGEYEKRLDLE